MNSLMRRWAVLVVTLSALAMAQSPQTGFPAFTNFHDSQFDHLNLENLNAVIPITLVFNQEAGAEPERPA